MVYSNSYEFANLPPVLAGSHGLRTLLSKEVDKTKVTSFAGADGKTQRIIYPGCFAGSTSDAGKVRPIPRTYLVDPLVASTTTTFTVATGTARNFVVTDALAVIAPYTVFTFASTWAAADTATAVIAGVTITITAAGSDLAVLATAMATAINASAYLKNKAIAISDGVAKVYVYAYDMVSLLTTTASEVTAGSGTFAAGAAAMAGGGSIGTVNAVDVTADDITLNAASSLTLPAGFPIGVLASLPFDENGQGYGLICPQEAVDLNWAANNYHGLFIGANVYESRLPYVDGQLKALFPEIKYV